MQKGQPLGWFAYLHRYIITGIYAYICTYNSAQKQMPLFTSFIDTRPVEILKKNEK